MGNKLGVLDSLGQFTVQNNIFSFFMGTVIGFTSSNLIKSFKVNMLDYYLFKLFKVPNSNIIIFITSIFEFLLILYLLYLVYIYLFKSIIEKYTKQQEDQVSWRKDLLDNIKEINAKLTKTI
jgi:large-conductance mechanosensitive channel